MGEVFLGEHTSIQSRVAVKLLHGEISREIEHVQRFFNEARIVSRIKHAGIVQIFDVGFHDGRAYLIMELLEGETLSQRLVRGRLSASQLAEIGRQTASILDATHRAGITHRDLKPDNIFLTHDDARDRVRILDFGIAKLSGPLATASAPRTQGAIGTPAYMAPEQWEDSSKVTWLADAYSLGCVLFEMGCGRVPFRAATMAEACHSHLHDPIPAMRAHVPDVPPALDAIVQRLLAKDPEQRAVSMAQISAELSEIAGDMPALAPTVGSWTPTLLPGSTPAPIDRPTTADLSTGEIVQRPSRKVRAIGGLLAAGVLATIIGVAVTRGSSDAADDQPPAASKAPALPGRAASPMGDAEVGSTSAPSLPPVAKPTPVLPMQTTQPMPAQVTPEPKPVAKPVASAPPRPKAPTPVVVRSAVAPTAPPAPPPPPKRTARDRSTINPFKKGEP